MMTRNQVMTKLTADKEFVAKFQNEIRKFNVEWQHDVEGSLNELTAALFFDIGTALAGNAARLSDDDVRASILRDAIEALDLDQSYYEDRIGDWDMLDAIHCYWFTYHPVSGEYDGPPLVQKPEDWFSLKEFRAQVLDGIDRAREEDLNIL